MESSAPCSPIKLHAGLTGACGNGAGAARGRAGGRLTCCAITAHFHGSAQGRTADALTAAFQPLGIGLRPLNPIAAPDDCRTPSARRRTPQRKRCSGRKPPQRRASAAAPGGAPARRATEAPQVADKVTLTHILILKWMIPIIV